MNCIHTITLNLLYLSAVGDLSKVSFKCPLNDKPVIVEKKFEIINLSVFIRSTESHLPISLSD